MKAGWPDPYTAKATSSRVLTGLCMRMADVIFDACRSMMPNWVMKRRPKTELTKVRSRAFLPDDQATKVTGYIAESYQAMRLKMLFMKNESWNWQAKAYCAMNLIREGRFPQAIKSIRDRQTAMVNGLIANGYYTFP